MNKLFFLSGLPRSGSTLLGSILSQHPEIQVTPTSPLSDLLCLTDENFTKFDVQYTYDKENITKNIYSSILNNFYSHIEKPYVIDKHRAWPRNVFPLKKFLSYTPKIIATNRRISEVVTSYISLIEKNKTENNFVDQMLMSQGKTISIDNRVECLWRDYISDPYQSMVYGLKNYSENIHIVDYNEFIENPQEELNKIYFFLEIDGYSHNFDNIYNWCKEDKDAAWGIEGLHDIRPKLGRTNRPPEEVIGEENTRMLDNFNIQI